MGQCFSTNNAVDPSDTKDEVYFDNNDLEGDRKQLVGWEERSCTDVIFLVIFIIFIIGLLVLIGYCMYYGDIYRIVNGYDDCANICGRPNTESIDPSSTCTRADMTTKRLLLVNSAGVIPVQRNKVHRQCVEKCDESEYREFLNRCIPKKSEKVVNTFFSKTGLTNFFAEVTEDLNLCWREIVYLSIIAFVFSVIVLVMFRFVIGVVVWIILIGVSLTTIIGTIFLWVMWVRERDALNQVTESRQDAVSQRKVYSYLAYSIIATVVSALILLVLLVMRKRISLVIQLFKEAGKAVSNMPLLLAEPVLTFIALAITVSLWIYFSIWVESAGYLTSETNQSFHYRKDVTMKVSRWYDLFALFWFTQFIIGCQHMVIAGAVGTWFFTRNKKNLDSPILKSFQRLVRFHLGTVVLGSLLIACVQMLRAVLLFLQKQLKGSTSKWAEYLLQCCQCCLYCLQNFLQYLSRNAYIETALSGNGFCSAGRQAFRLLSSNALRVVAINSVGDFILFLGKAFVVMTTLLVGIELIQKKQGVQHSWVPLSVAGAVAYLTSHCFMTVYEMVIDSIFICFCEDCERNDGISRPYYMSRGLMEFVQNSKKVLAIQDEDRAPKEAWNAPSTVAENVQE